MSASGMAEVGALVDPVEGNGDRADAGQWRIEDVAIEDRQWGYHTLVVRDPDGNELFFPYPDDYPPDGGAR